MADSRGIISRPMRWPVDAEALHRLVAEAFGRLGPCVSLHPGDLTWRKALREIEDFQVFEDDSGRILGLVEQDPADASCDIVVQPDALGLERDLFLWAEEQARRRGGMQTFTVGCFGGNRERHELLTALGYERTDHFYPHFLCELDRLERRSPPSGYTIRPLRTPDEIPRRVELSGLAFGGTSLSVARYDALRTGPGYDPGLALVASNADGTPVAFANFWYDPFTHTGELEPVGCDPAHRRRGLARAVIEEGLCRLHERGATHAVVYTGHTNAGARALYELIGFRIVGEDYDYTKPLP